MISQSTPLSARTLRFRSPRAFTIVELLVVVGIIALLMGILVTGIRGAIGSARKTRELNGLRGVYAAWYQYANTYEEQLLPGFLDEQTQVNWKVNYTNTSSGTVSQSLSQTYPWRLARFMDDPYGTMISYIESENSDANTDVCGEWDGVPTHPAWMAPAFGVPGSTMALQPAFAYNAFYMGGWYRAANGVSSPAYADAAWTMASGGAVTGRLVCTRLANISRTSEVIVFAASALRAPGNYRTGLNPEDRIPGNSWIVPPMLGSTSVWEPFMGMQQSITMAESEGGTASFMNQSGMTDSGVIQVNVVQGVPVRRHNSLVATVKADGSTESAGIGALMDMRVWIDAADRSDFTHGDN
jgi:prepilin-type N-terminal cleavage/methylation domain-containing protein